MSDKITKLCEIRESIKKLITEYNITSDQTEDLESKLILLTYSGSELFTSEQLEHMTESGEEINGEHTYIGDYSPLVFSPLAENWVSSSLTC